MQPFSQVLITKTDKNGELASQQTWIAIMTHERSLSPRNLDEGQLVNGLALLLERTGFRWREQASRLPGKRQVLGDSEDARLGLLCNAKHEKRF